MSPMMLFFCGLMMVVAPQVSFAGTYQMSKGFVAIDESSCHDLIKFCPCGKKGEPFVTVPVKMCFNMDSVTSQPTCRPCNDYLFQPDICEKYKKCNTCSSQSCMTCPRGKSGKFCTENIKGNHVNASPIVYPLSLRIPRGEPIRHNRMLRDRSGCQLPDQLQTADLNCILYDYKITCNQTCAWGTAMKEGNALNFECTYRNKYWNPRNFEECTPIVNCKVELVSNGEMSCLLGRIAEPDKCDITCTIYDEEEGGYIPRSTYTCDLNGVYTPPLPYCAKINSTAAV